MFITQVEDEDKFLALKPMNCPCHIQIFRQGMRSYRELPLRMAEFGSCHRYEPSGALHGIMRVRALHPGRRAHLLHRGPDRPRDRPLHRRCCRRSTATSVFRISASSSPTGRKPRIGSDELWDQAEGALREACAIAGVEYELNPGEGAFYGPKLEFVLRDAIGRDWQCGTLQVDPNLPERLDAEYVGEDGARHRPIMLHRAIFGSFERFLGILIEQYAGRFPLWLAPVQAVVATIVSDADDYAREVAAAFARAGLAVETDLTNQKINAKVREHSLAHVPVLAVVGRKEAEGRTVALRRLGSQAQEILSLEEAVVRLASEATPPDLISGNVA